LGFRGSVKVDIVMTWNSGCGVEGVEVRVLGSGFRVWASGLRA